MVAELLISICFASNGPGLVRQQCEVPVDCLYLVCPSMRIIVEIYEGLTWGADYTCESSRTVFEGSVIVTLLAPIVGRNGVVCDKFEVATIQRRKR